MAAALIDFLRVTIPGLNRIRCTSVSGYGLPAGAHVDSQLQKEVGEAATLIALMTGVSVESAYVLFEVGARWGAGRHCVPLLAAGASPKVLRGPLGGYPRPLL